MNIYSIIFILFYSIIFSYPKLVTSREMKNKNPKDAISKNIIKFISDLDKKQTQKKMDKLYKFDMIYGEMNKSLDNNEGKYFVDSGDTYYVGKYAISKGKNKFYDTQRVTVYTLFNTVYQIESYGDDDNDYYLITDGDFKKYSPTSANRTAENNNDGFRWYKIKNNILPGPGKFSFKSSGISKKVINYSLLSGTLISCSITGYYQRKYNNSVQPHVRYEYKGRRNQLFMSDVLFAIVYGWYLIQYNNDGIW